MKKMIVADDDEMFRQIIKRHLQPLGFEAVELDSGLNIIESIRDANPVACIIDIMMDDKEGIETIREISRLNSRPPVIAVSSNETYLEFAVELGADASLKKPVTPASLAQTLKQLGLLEEP